jgi:L-malate glycosyltransferase
MSKVVIFQYRLFHYRMELFHAMRELAARRGLDLVVVAGQAYGKERLKKDEGQLGWETKVSNLFFPVGEKKDLCWQPLPACHRDADLLVFMQENRLLANYWWILKRKLRLGPLVAYWGHGRDFQSRAPGGLRERWKRRAIGWVDWWFAYTSMTVDFVRSSGFAGDRITQLNNAIDVRRLARDWADAPAELVHASRLRYGISDGAPVGIFCGSLYSDKKLELLFDAADRIRAACPGFVLIVIGDGPMGPFVREAVASRPWATWDGARRGTDKAVAFGLATVMLNPGLVGLHILDAFSMGLPMITTRTAQHSPEIAYLVPDVNGLMLEETVDAYGGGVIELLSDPRRLAAMRAAAREHAMRYTVEAMAENFVNGIEAALKLGGAASR